jgi:NhaP-type Na+/H+ or K+/H+ antiporter
VPLPLMVETRESTWTRIKFILESKVFVFLSLSISGLYFLVTGIQYWISDYL